MVMKIRSIVLTENRVATKLKSVLKEYDTEKYKEYDFKELKNYIYDNFVSVQNAWMNFDYDSLKELCGDELFTSYKSDLEVLKAANNKNIMKKFKRHKCEILDVVEDKKTITIKCALFVSFKDYVVNAKGRVVKGSRFKIFNNLYKLEYVINKKVVDTCPSCGAKIEGSLCNYCHTVLIDNNDKLVLVNKNLVK